VLQKTRRIQRTWLTNHTKCMKAVDAERACIVRLRSRERKHHSHGLQCIIGLPQGQTMAILQRYTLSKSKEFQNLAKNPDVTSVGVYHTINKNDILNARTITSLIIRNHGKIGDSFVSRDNMVNISQDWLESHTKVKLLVRSHAMREETSPPPDPDAHLISSPGTVTVQQQPQQPQTISNNSLSVGRPSSRHKLRHQEFPNYKLEFSHAVQNSECSTAQQGKAWYYPLTNLSNTMATQEGKRYNTVASYAEFSRVYTDSTGVDLQQFITDTLNRNQKDRMLLLKIEQELVSLAKDNKRNHFKFPQMSSYQRMLVHRVAAYFGMDHNVDQTGNAVIVNRTKNTRLPDTKFRDHIREELLFPEEPRRSILKRDSSSFEESCNFK
ncbi:hypothetical protein L9F63_022764, partial [Diploptera punctata]